MDDKLLAGLGTAAAIAPLCALCILGPAAIAAMFTGAAGWLGGFDAALTAGLVMVAGIAVFAMVRRRNAQRVPAKPAGEVGR
jgi:membrane protein implicated in regulation of membrane protease activity